MTNALSIVLSLAVAYTASLAWLFRVQYVAAAARDGLAQQREDYERDREAWEARLERVEQTASSVERLAVSFEYLTARFSTDLKYFSERQADAQNFVSAQLIDIKQELSHVRANAAMAKEMASRGARRIREG
jgi:hypothetical protein